MTTVQTLQSCCLFAGLNSGQLEEFTPFSTHVTVEDGAVLFRQGDPAKFLYVVERGKAVLELSVRKPDGSYARPTTVATVGPGDAFGWSSVVEPHVMTLSARAAGRCELVAIDAPTLREYLRRYRDTGYAFMVGLSELLAERLMQTRETLIYERGLAVLA